MTTALHSSDYRAFADHLVALRKKAQLTQEELAGRLNKPQSFVSKFERLERRLDPSEFRNIVIALGYDAGREFAKVSRSLDRAGPH